MKKIFKKMLLLTTFILALFLVSCSSNETENGSDETSAIFVPGTYTGEAESHGGPMKVSVTVDETSITSIDFDEYNDSDFSLDARDLMVERIIEANSADVDTVSGATLTSTAVREAVSMALSSAYVDGAVVNNTADTEEDNIEDVTTDVVVIGGGGAGLSAAITAKENGADVILVEKLAFVGGNTNYATGGLNAAETDQQAALGIEDDIETFYNDTMEGGKNVNDPELVKTLTENAKATVDWLTGLGADLSDVGILGGSTNPRAHRPTGGAPVGSHIVEVLKTNADEMGVDIRTETKAIEILTNDDGVEGIVVEDANGSQYTIYADSVVIASGGFGANNELVASIDPSLEGFGTTNAPGATGDVFEFADGLDLDYVDLEYIQTHPTVMPSNNYMITEAVRGTGAILVNREAQRFVNELETRDVVSEAELEQTGGTVFLVFDQNVRENLAAIDGYYEKGYLQEANSIEELAETLEIPAEELVTTIDTYNSYVTSGADADFGRDNMSSTIEKAPFYAVEVGPAVHHTMGGLKIDSEAQVYNTSGEAVNGLYAAGEVTGGVHGANRLGGNAMADITVFGHIAGGNASTYALEK